MQIKLYNTASRKKENFQPINKNKPRLYVCGPTVYDDAHIGNARPLIVFDILFRLLRYRYGNKNVTYVRNITDVDDKINEQAKKLNKTINDITTYVIRRFKEDTEALQILNPRVEPRATEHIPHMIEMIKKLIKSGNAYHKQGHVLFHVETDPKYGSLSRRNPEEMKAGARIEIAPYKKNPLDFILWKPSDQTLPGWESPWGKGRPGWHIECSAMAELYLGTQFDIHGGGIDLVFPHHENESAQSCAVHNVPFMAKIWMHNGYLKVNGQKMSKSIGNVLTIRQLRKQYHPPILRLQMIMTHYRHPIDWKTDKTNEAENIIKKWHKIISKDKQRKSKDDTPSIELLNALADDLNTPKAIAVINQNAAKAEKGDLKHRAQLARNLRFLGLFDKNLLPKPTQQKCNKLMPENQTIHNMIHTLIQMRNIARKSKNFKRADKIRDQLKQAGIETNDTKNNSQWHQKENLNHEMIKKIYEEMNT